MSQLVRDNQRMTTKADWVEVGRRLKAARKTTGISARRAAKSAPMSATWWQDLERGFRLDGGNFNPSDEKLEAAARVVGLDPMPLFELVGRSYRGPQQKPAPDRIAAIEQRVDAIEGELRAIRDEFLAQPPADGSRP